jgi:hypothetical protein
MPGGRIQPRCDSVFGIHVQHCRFFGRTPAAGKIHDPQFLYIALAPDGQQVVSFQPSRGFDPTTINPYMTGTDLTRGQYARLEKSRLP